jgi:hypothetical protein
MATAAQELSRSPTKSRGEILTLRLDPRTAALLANAIVRQVERPRTFHQPNLQELTVQKEAAIREKKIKEMLRNIEFLLTITEKFKKLLDIGQVDLVTKYLKQIRSLFTLDQMSESDFDALVHSLADYVREKSMQKNDHGDWYNQKRLLSIIQKQ